MISPIIISGGLGAIATACVGYGAHYSLYKNGRERKRLMEDEIIGHDASQGVDKKDSLGQRVGKVEASVKEVRAVLHMNGPGSDEIAAKVLAAAVRQAAEILAEAKTTAQAKVLADAMIAAPRAAGVLEAARTTARDKLIADTLTDHLPPQGDGP